MSRVAIVPAGRTGGQREMQRAAQALAADADYYRMSIPSISSVAPSRAAGTSAKETDRTVAVMKAIKREQATQATALVELIEQSGTTPTKGQNLNVYV